MKSARPKIVHSGTMTFSAILEKRNSPQIKTGMGLIDRPIRLRKKSKQILCFHFFQDSVQSLDTTHFKQNTQNERERTIYCPIT